MLDPERRQAYLEALDTLSANLIRPVDVATRLDTLSLRTIRQDWLRLGLSEDDDGRFERTALATALRQAAADDVVIYEPALWERLDVAPIGWETVTGLTQPHAGSLDGLLAAEAAARWGALRGFEDLLAPAQSQVTPHPYQLAAVTRVLREMKGCAILADEVGLGKTIEAGLILKEYLLRDMARSALILVPASLVDQWHDELADRFGIQAKILTRPGQSASAEIALVSVHRAKTSLAEELQRRHWDVLIVDEAHMLKNHATVGYKFVFGLPRTYTLLLTATPVQNDLRELYNLITLAKPGLLRSRRHFRSAYMADRRKAKNVDLLKDLLSEVMIRNRRSKTLVELPPRHVHTVEVELGEADLGFHQAVVRFAQRVYYKYVKGTVSLGFDGVEVDRLMLALVVLLKESCSSHRAVLATLTGSMRRRLVELAAKTGDDRDLTELDRVILTGQALERHPKFPALAKLLAAHPRPTIVYSEFRHTLEALRDYLGGLGHRVTLFHGGLTGPQKRRALADFRANGGVLLASEAGGQGLNLQFCQQLVNYDIPWNPTRLEQRIGRVHRFGQEQPVHIFNLNLRASIEEYVLYVLTDKINMFQQVIGELETILTFMAAGETVSFEFRLSRLILEARDFTVIRDQLRKLGEALRKASDAYQDARTQTQNLLDPLD